MNKPKLSRYLLVISICALLLFTFLLIGFEPQTRNFFSKRRMAPYPFPLNGGQSELSELGTHQINFLENRIARNPSSALDRSALASTYAQLAKRTGDTTLYDKAAALAQESLKQLPISNPAAKLTLATVAEARHQFAQAIRLAREVQAEGKKTDGLSLLITSHLALGDLSEAAAEADTLVNLRPSLGSLALKALVLTAQGRDEEAEFTFKRALRLEDVGEQLESAWTRCLLGRFYLRHGNVSDARGLFEEAQRIIPHYHFALSLMGELELQLNHPEKAEKLFFDAFTRSRQMPYFRNYGISLKLQGKSQPASEVEKEAFQLMKAEMESKTYGHRLELAQLMIDRNTPADLKAAMTLITEELKTRKSAPSYFALANASVALKDWESAREAIQAVLRTGVREAKYFRLAAFINRNLGNHDLGDFFDQAAAKLNQKNSFILSSVL